MKMKGMKMAAIALAASLACAPMTTFVGTTVSAAGQTYSLNGAGQHKGTGPDGYSFEIWAADTSQPSSMTLGDNGTFSTEWNCAGPSGNFLARRGIDMGSTKKFQEYGGITCDFDCEWSSSSSGNSRLCIYGWTRSPLVEYYIVEDWANWCPPNGQPGQGNVLKQFTLDGSTYSVYKENRNSYTIDGNQPFVQYYSVRHTRRQSGTISVSKHFEQWEDAGLQMGVMYEVAFNVEGWESNGKANVKKNTITMGKEPEPEKPIEADANGYYLKESFESGAGDWSGRGAAKVAASSGYDGSKGILVSGRTDNWNGASINLSSNPFKPGETFAFGTAVMQDSESSVDFKLTLQYIDSSGSEKYDEVKTVTAPKGQWVDLSNSSYTIPTGASSMVLYVEAPESLTDFYIDGAYAGVKGTKPLLDISQSQPVTQPPTTQPPTTQPPTGPSPSGVTMWGDTNLDNNVELSDAILIMQHLANPNKYSYNGTYERHLTKQGALNGDVYENGSGLSSADALSIQKKLLNMISSLPESYLQGVQPVYTTTTVTTTTRPTTTTTTTTTAPKPITTTTTTPPSSSGIPDKGTPMNANATMVSDFRTGNAGDFFASDGWTNGKPFDCWWYKQNAQINNGALELKIDQKWTNDSNSDWNPRYSGGEFRTNNFYSYGYYECSMQAIKNDGVVSSFFTYTGPSDVINGQKNPWDEIDIEILGKDTTKVQLNYYRNGQGGHEKMIDLGFDASEAYHTYGFDWQPGKITWYIDGKEVWSMQGDIPVTASKIMMNAWPGLTVDDWLKAYNGRTPLTAHYQWVTYDKNGKNGSGQQQNPWQDPNQGQNQNPWQDPNQGQNQNPNQGQTQSGMNRNATMVSDFTTGNAGDFFASDGWTNGKPFDCWWYKQNAQIKNGLLELKIDQKWSNDSNSDWNPRYSGGEFRTNDFYHYGYYETEMKAIKCDGVVSSFFTYTGPSDVVNGQKNPWDEIDIEILGKDTTKVQLNYYRNGQGGHEKMIDLGFDASQDFHRYGFDWQPGKITWYVDGKEVWSMQGDVPVTPSKIMMNAWPGLTVDDWLKAYPGTTPLTAYYKWVTYNKQ